MIVARIRIPLEQSELGALLKISHQELRNPESQALFFVRQELERLGYLEPLSHGQRNEAVENDSISAPCN